MNMPKTTLALVAILAILALGSCASCAPAAPHDDAAVPQDTGDPKMTAQTFTANAGTDQLTITAHGLFTDDGPAAVRNIGGALPGGLAAMTDYFVIRVDPNTLKLATSSANALAGIFIDLTTNGTGTNILEVGVPYRRPRTYAPGVQLFSVDLNANFDAWTALYALLTGQAQSVWDGVTLRLADTIWLLGSDGTFNTSSTLTRSATAVLSATSGGAQSVLYRIPLPAGRRISSITVHGLAGNTAGETFAASFIEGSPTGGIVNNISTQRTSGTSGAAETIGWTTADTEFSTNGYTMTDNPHYLDVTISQTSAAAEVQIRSIKIVTN